MKLLADENIPLKLVRFLESLNNEIQRVSTSSTDFQIVGKALQEKRLIITLDKDFESIALRYPETFDAILVRIHPPFAEALIQSFKSLIAVTTLESIKGFNIMTVSGLVRIK